MNNELYRNTRTGEIKTAQEWIDDMGGYENAINPTPVNSYDEVIDLSLFESALLPLEATDCFSIFLGNEYQALFPNYSNTPKAVIAAMAVSFAIHATGEDQVPQVLKKEWEALHNAGIVPQKPAHCW
jgi:hypothetical protein